MPGFTYPRSYGPTKRDDRALQTYLEKSVPSIDGDGVLRGYSSAYPTLIPALAATSGVVAYPEGYSTMLVSSDTSWPHATGLVETYVTGASTGGWRIYQVMRPKSAAWTHERYSSDGTTWDNWRLTAPVKELIGSGTNHTTSTPGTWETAHTFTMSTSFPTARFEATVDASIGCYSGDAATLKYMRLQVSLDGGSTWTTGRASVSGAGWGTFFSATLAGGAVTGTIQVRIQVRSDSSNSTFRQFGGVVTIGNNY